MNAADQKQHANGCDDEDCGVKSVVRSVGGEMVDVVMWMSESVGVRSEKGERYFAALVARDEREAEAAQRTDKGSCSLPIVVTLTVMWAWGCGCGLYSDGGGEVQTRRRRLRDASDVDQDRPRSAQESRGMTRTIRATIAYHQRVHISIVAIVIRHCMSDAEHLEPVLELHLRGPTLFDLAQHASHTVLRQAAIADRRSFLDVLFDTHKG